MAQTFNGPDGTQTVPGATAAFTVKSSAGGLSTTGVIALIGEADGGPDWSIDDINALKQGFGPNSESAVTAKYLSGPLVDGYRAAANPLVDPDIQGSPNKIILIKTNKSTKASAALLNYDASNWGTLFDKGYGLLGTLISKQVTANQAESLPTTGPFTWIPSVGTVNLGFRVNGAALVTAALTANMTPTAAVAAIAALSGLSGTSGGAVSATAQSSVGNVALTVVSGNAVTIAYTGTFTNVPAVGSTIVIPAASVLIGAANANVGAYVVTAASTNSISCTKLSDAAKPGAVIGTITAPANVSSTPVSATVANDIVNYGTVTVTLTAGNPTPGLGKSLEVAELATGTDLFSRIGYNLSTTGVTWISKNGSPQLLTSVAEYKATLNIARQVDNISETITAGGEIGLTISYAGTTATVTVGPTTLSTTVTGGTGVNLNLALKNYPTIADLATYINSQTGYKASAGTAAVGQQPTLALDEGTFGICTQFGALVGRVKIDAYRFFNAVSSQSQITQIGNPALAPSSGLPGPDATVSFLATGTLVSGNTARGATTNAFIQAAVDALKKMNVNFPVPLFSRDATGDITDGLTDSGSTYTIASIHSIFRTHMVNMSKRLAKKNRQGFLSIRDTYLNAKLAAANVANYRCSMSFLDQKVTDSNSNITQFQPWMDAVIAAGGQAAGGYKGLTKKLKNVSGSLQAAGDWDGSDEDLMTDALLAGLLPTRNRDDGGFEYASDQTTYVKDANFVYNSIQAVYAADVVAMSTRLSFEDEYVGKSQADVSAAQALTFLEGLMQEFMREKFITASDDAPAGFKNPSIQISGPTMLVSCEVKISGTIYFIPISFVVSMVQQTATQGA